MKDLESLALGIEGNNSMLFTTRELKIILSCLKCWRIDDEPSLLMISEFEDPADFPKPEELRELLKNFRGNDTLV